MTQWIDRLTREPPLDRVLIVWGEGWPSGVVAVMYDYNVWLDVVDHVDVTFRYWQFAPDSPYNAHINSSTSSTTNAR